MEIYSQREYIPLVKPNSRRHRGYHRRIYSRISDIEGITTGIGVGKNQHPDQ